MNAPQAVHYRCPQCHYLVDAWVLFGICCPMCGWVSPLARRDTPQVAEHEAYIDVIYDGDLVRVTTELPAFSGEPDRIYVSGNTLVISAGRVERIVPLRYAVGREIERTYRNGVLEVVLRKAGRCLHGGEKDRKEKAR